MIYCACRASPPGRVVSSCDKLKPRPSAGVLFCGHCCHIRQAHKECLLAGGFCIECTVDCVGLRSKTSRRMIGNAVLCRKHSHTWWSGGFYSTIASPSQYPPQNARRSGGRFRRVAGLHQYMLPAPFSLLDEWRGQVRSVKGRGVWSFLFSQRRAGFFNSRHITITQTAIMQCGRY